MYFNVFSCVYSVVEKDKNKIENKKNVIRYNSGFHNSTIRRKVKSEKWKVKSENINSVIKVFDKDIYTVLYLNFRWICMIYYFYPLLLDLLDAFKKNDRSLVLNLLCNSNIDFKRPIDEQGNTFLHSAAKSIYGRMVEMVMSTVRILLVSHLSMMLPWIIRKLVQCYWNTRHTLIAPPI